LTAPPAGVTQYFPATSKQAAKAQNQTWWENVLGHAVNPGDTTLYLFMIHTSQNTGNVMVTVNDPELTKLWPTLTTQQQNFFNTNVLQANDPKVTAFFAEIPPPLAGAE
jgi:hypothetical protein